MLEKLLWNVSCEERFRTRLCKFTGLKIDLRFNENRSTMLNLLERRGRSARLSIHRMFLDAPDDVLQAVAEYVRGKRRSKLDYHHILRAYIETRLPEQNYRHRVDESRLRTAGAVYDLQAIYDRHNRDYFGGELNLNITWFGRGFRSKRPRRITFGLYEDPLKLIKIHQMLDDSFFPPYFVSFIVYHEMVHAVVPGEMNEKGQFCVHTPLFKAREKLFPDYGRALAWEKQNINNIFSHGRT